jgi:8-oxo-dGTP pyrophosphatase MutT (NUDIX family)
MDAMPIPSPQAQVAALPYRLVDGRAEVLLVTARRSGRWIIPKGSRKKGVEPHDMAAREAFEEAGVLGRVDARPIGSYGHRKRLAAGGTVACEVVVFLLAVERELPDWPERRQRRRRWVSPARAAFAVAKLGLVLPFLRLSLPWQLLRPVPARPEP